MKIFGSIFCALVFILASCESGQTPAERLEKEMAAAVKNAIADRDLRQYERGGIFTCRTRLINGNEKDRLAGEKKVRDFIWQYWTQRKRAYVILNCPGTDTVRTTHYFIEPDETGAWHVALNSILITSDDRAVPGEANIEIIERAPHENGENWTLLLKTADGELVESLPLY